MDKVRDEILSILLWYRDIRHLLADEYRSSSYLRSMRIRDGREDDEYLHQLKQWFVEDIEDILCNHLEESEELRAYRNFFSFMDIHINYTMNHDEIRKGIDLMGALGRSLRAGNGEIPWWENERMRNNVIRKMGEIKSGK